MSNSQFTNLGRVFDAIASDAWDSFLNNDHQRAHRLARQLLQQPRLGDVLAAAMHMILATANDDAISHARQAVHLYEHLFDDIDEIKPSDEEWRHVALAHAQELLDKAMEDHNASLARARAEYGSDEAARDASIAKFGEAAGEKFDQEEAFLNKSDEDDDDDGDCTVEYFIGPSGRLEYRDLTGEEENEGEDEARKQDAQTGN